MTGHDLSAFQDAQEAPTRALRDAGTLDLEGRHGEAIALLSRAAAGGDLAAKRTVGLRILLGDRAPHLGSEGSRLVAEAGREGDAHAANIAAVLAGAGIYRPQSWTEALDWLQLSAELGFARARGALSVLAGIDPLAGRTDWAALRASVDLPGWIAPPPARTVSHDPLIRAYPGFAGGLMCDWLVAQARGRLRRAEVYNPSTSRPQITEERTNSVAHSGLLETELAQIILQARIAAAIGVPFAHFEPLAILHYAIGQVFEDHYDFVDPDAPEYAADFARNGQRPYTFLLYLNADYEGGETAFPRLGLDHRGERGTGLLFANVAADGTPDRRMLHAGRPPLRGEKWVLSQFVRDRKIVPGVSAAG